MIFIQQHSCPFVWHTWCYPYRTLAHQAQKQTAAVRSSFCPSNIWRRHHGCLTWMQQTADGTRHGDMASRMTGLGIPTSRRKRPLLSMRLNEWEMNDLYRLRRIIYLFPMDTRQHYHCTLYTNTVSAKCLSVTHSQIRMYYYLLWLL